jgi:hypothetical protein
VISEAFVLEAREAPGSVEGDDVVTHTGWPLCGAHLLRAVRRGFFGGLWLRAFPAIFLFHVSPSGRPQGIAVNGKKLLARM